MACQHRFTTPEEAAEAIGAFDADYLRRAKAAGRLAEERFGSDRILTSILERAC